MKQNSTLNRESYLTESQLLSEKKFTEKNEEVSTSLNRVSIHQWNNSSNITIISGTNLVENVNENNMLGSNYIIQENSVKEEFSSVPSSESNSPFVALPNNNIDLNNNHNHNNDDNNGISLKNEQKLSDKEQTNQSENMSKSQLNLSQPNTISIRESNKQSLLTTMFQNLYLRTPHYTAQCICFSRLHPSLTLILICTHHSSKVPFQFSVFISFIFINSFIFICFII
jgi:hypothetical protein